MSRESDARAAELARLPHTGRTQKDAEDEVARVTEGGATPNPGDSD